MNNKNYAVLCFVFLLQACTTPSQHKVSLSEYLQQFIGQSVQDIEQNINLKSLGYQTLERPRLLNNQLSYTILRPMNIPTPMVTNVDIGGTAVPLQLGNSSANSYDVNFNCKIIFNLNNQIAESIHYEGKAC
ncbi:hypothetical protein [Acinetobacter ihumii]|uniref:hypothetical protein n=1 Tax=Acinetobacter ihumii TaxID=2483802 RepID=UPI0013EEFE39|nr:hypothetical protein [Acinetobacter ihumii]